MVGLALLSFLLLVLVDQLGLFPLVTGLLLGSIGVIILGFLVYVALRALVKGVL